jgi:hypothetical protein
VKAIQESGAYASTSLSRNCKLLLELGQFKMQTVEKYQKLELNTNTMEAALKLKLVKE